MTWSPYEQDLLLEQVAAVLPVPGIEDAAAVGVPALLDAMPGLQRLGLRAAVWWTAFRARRGGVVAAVRGMDAGGWMSREVAAVVKAMAGLVWEYGRAALAAEEEAGRIAAAPAEEEGTLPAAAAGEPEPAALSTAEEPEPLVLIAPEEPDHLAPSAAEAPEPPAPSVADGSDPVAPLAVDEDRS